MAQCGGWVMPKHAPPGYDPIVPQLRPDEAVITNPLDTWHWHGTELIEWPVFPEEAGALAGEALWRYRILSDADAHVSKGIGKDDSDPYDPRTGKGDHQGINVEGVHRHAPRAAKYLLQGGKGAGSRIDVHPWALERIPDADIVWFILEGCPKNDAVVSAGAAVFSVPSVTCWKAQELRRFANRYLRGKTVLVVPDSDWVENPQVQRAALKARTVLRGCGIEAHCCAPRQLKDDPTA